MHLLQPARDPESASPNLLFHFSISHHLDDCQGLHSMGVFPAFPLIPTQTDTIPAYFLSGNYEIKVWCSRGSKLNQKLHGDFCT